MSDSRPNVVLVTVDSLRADHCGHLGDDRGLTPTLSALADDGVAFRNAVAPGPQTFSSMPATFTGAHRPPSRGLDGGAGGRNAGNEPSADAGDDVPEDDASLGEWATRLAAIDRHVRRRQSLPERLRGHGYATAAISPNPWTSTASGFDRGFDRFVDVAGTDSRSRLDRIARRVLGEHADRRSVELAVEALSGEAFFAQWRSFYDRLLETVDALPEPYFLWVFVLDSHFPYLASWRDRREQTALGMWYGTLRAHRAIRGHTDSLADSATRRTAACYRDAVRGVDAFLYRLTTDLASDDPVTVVHADHGESLGDHGNYGHHHRHVYEENVHVPYVVHGTDATGVVDDPAPLARLPDVVESIARTGSFDPGTATTDVAIARSEDGRHRTARGRRFKLVDCAGDRALYDLAADSDEREDVASDHPGVAARLADALRTHDRRVAERDRLEDATDALALTGHF